MGFSAFFIGRPVGTTLLALGLLIAGAVGYRFLAVAPLPNTDLPAIVVFANDPGADPATIAASVAAPLERHLGVIPGLNEMTSINSTGASSIVLLFSVDRSIDGAAQDVQAAINAALPDLPADLPFRPYYRKFNPAEAPILTIALTSPRLSISQLFDAADSVIAQRLSQVDGVAQVQVSGAGKPAIRIAMNPTALMRAGISPEDVRNAIKAANVTEPTGELNGANRAAIILVNGQIEQPPAYRALVLKSVPEGVLQLSDVASVSRSVADTRLAAWDGARQAILLTVTKQAGANVIKTADAVRALLPELKAWLPAGIHIQVISDRTATIRASIADIQMTLLFTVVLVLLVVLLFLRRLVPLLAAAASVPLSIAGTLAVMWAEGFTIDNFSLMTIAISVGFVVDDSIVMIENITRCREQGLAPLQAALRGARQISFTVSSISFSLIAVFIPSIFVPGLLGRLFHEFAITLAIAILVSMLVSLTLTPMLCGQLERASLARPLLGHLDDWLKRGFAGLLVGYTKSLDWVLGHRRLMLVVTLAAVAATIALYRIVPKGLLPTEDTGLILGQTIARADVSFPAMKKLQQEVVKIILADPAVASVGSRVGVNFGFNSLNRGHLIIQLKRLSARRISSETVIARLRRPLSRLIGVQVFLRSAQHLHTGGRETGGLYQFVVLDPDLTELTFWTQRIEAKLREDRRLTDISSDTDNAGPQMRLVIDRAVAARLGVSVAAIDAILNDSFSQRQISTMYRSRNQYPVVLEVASYLQENPSSLSQLYVGAANGAQIPLSALVRPIRTLAPLTIRHQGLIPAATISFNLAPGVALSDAVTGIKADVAALLPPPSLRTEFASNARYFLQSLTAVPLLLLTALLAIYIVLGILYESLTQPLTILSTLPSAGIGALLALLLTGTPLSIVAVIGIVLLMGIVKKNAIMMVDFALAAERDRGLQPLAAIREAALTRLRPILMTTLAALFGAMPLAFAGGVGSELRSPFGISIIGGLIVSQALTLYTTPIVYLALEW